MGLGKTVITLTAIKELKYYRFEVNRALVIAPKKVAEATWSREAQKWDHTKDLRIRLVLGPEQQRLRALNTPGDIWIINRENVKWLVDYYRNDWPFDMVVIDESSSFKNHQAKRFKALVSVRPHIKRIVELTGTPSPNGLLDLWAQIYLLDGGQRLGKYITHYRERYFEPDKRCAAQIWSWKPKRGAAEAIREKIADICVSMRTEDYLQLPDLITHDVPVELDEAARRRYRELERKMLLEIGEATISVTSAAALSNKLTQLCNGAIYDDSHSAYEVHGCKLQALAELIESLNGQPVLVYYSFQSDVPRITKALSGMGLRVRELRSAADAKAWNSREVDVLLAHPASAAYGLNLQDGGNHIVWFGLPWSLELYQQANKRLHRQGQTQKVIIHRLLVTDSRDEDIAAALDSKGASQDALIESLKVRIDKARKELINA